jgi:NitT/TauT family transport system substrate-binding protein
MRRGVFGIGVTALLAIAVLAGGCRKVEHTKKPGEANVPPATVRIGYFGNLTHAQAVLGVSSGEFADAIKPSALSTKVFNAGPSLIEALLAGEIDVGYVGPGPALNAHVKGHGKSIRVISGAAANGVLIVAGKDSGIRTLEDLRGKKIATPQHGNTQDIAATHYLTHVLGQEDARNVIPIPNPEQLKMMEDKQIDAAWAPEPWGSRLVAQAGAHLVAEEKDIWPGKIFALTLVVTTPEFLENHPDVVRKMLEVHHHWTVRLQQEPEKYVPQLGEALFALNGKKLPPGVLDKSIKTVRFLDDPLADTLKTMGDWAFELKLSPHPGSLTGLIDTSILDSIAPPRAP